MIARTDFQRYPLGAALLENFLVLPQGGIARRPGTEFIAEVKDSSKTHRLIPFVFSTIQAYVLEMGDETLRFYGNRGRLAVANVTGTIANGTFDADVASWDDRDTGGSAASTWNSGGWMQLLGDGTEYAWREQSVTVTTALEYTVRFRIRGIPGDRVEVRVGTATLGSQLFAPKEFGTGWHAITFTSSGTTAVIGFRHNKAHAIGVDDVSIADNVPLEIATFYSSSELAAVHRAQSADVLFLTHPDHPPAKVNRYSNLDWSFEEIDFLDGPYLDQNTTATTLTASATGAVGGTVTITASAVTGINGGQGFLATDVGRLVRRLNSTTHGYARIQSITSTTEVEAVVYRAFGATTGVTTWSLGAWSGTTGYPATLGFFQQRLCYAATEEQPQTIWMSQTADFENFEPDSVPSGGGARQQEADDALAYTLAGNEVNVIRWFSAAKKSLLVGTIGAEWRITSNGANVQFDDIDAQPETTFGSANIQPVRARGRTMFVQRAARKLFEQVFEFQTDTFEALDQNLLSDHITKGGITEVAYQQELDSVLWCLRADGVVPTLTYQPEQRVVGWGRQIFGGTYLGEDAVCESVAVIPASGYDEVWAIVKRTINGNTERYVEALAPAFEGGTVEGNGDDRALAIYCDSAVVYNDPKTITAATKADPVVITAASHGFSNGDRVRIEDVVGMTEINDTNFVVANKTDNTFELTDADGNDIDGTSYTTYITGGEVRERVNSLSGADHVEGETVAVLADGAVHPAVVVASGVVALDDYYSKVVVGLPYSHEYTSLKWEAGAAGGTAQGQTKRIDTVVFMLLDSLGGEFGRDEDNLIPFSFRRVGDAMNAPPPLFTGEKRESFPGEFSTDPRIHIESDDPVPFTLLALSPHLKTNQK